MMKTGGQQATCEAKDCGATYQVLKGQDSITTLDAQGWALHYLSNGTTDTWCPEHAYSHRPVPGDDFMPAGWCGGCEHCYPAATVCLACSYDPPGSTDPEDIARAGMKTPVNFPCAFA